MKLPGTIQKLFSFLILSLLTLGVVAAEVDTQLLESLNSEAGHDKARRKLFPEDQNAKKLYDNQREKELALFLEQQEKWEQSRERGLNEYRHEKKDKSPTDDGPEFKEDLKARQLENRQKEKARILVAQTREKIISQMTPAELELEYQELNLMQNRPRYDVRKRGKNKWVAGNKPGKPVPATGGGGFAPPPAAFDDFPPTPDFAPVPGFDNFEEIPPPPPPPINFDGSMGFGGVDSGFGEIPPPPPPPPMDEDF